jgi:hypothetical protein
MKKKTDFYEQSPGAFRGRVLARTLAEDLRLVRGEGALPPIQMAVRTDPPPGFDVTFSGSDAF